MTTCDDCGEATDVGWTPGDGAVLCRACYEERGAHERPLRLGRRGYVSPDRYERNREAIDHAEARHRSRRLQGLTSGGRRL